MTQDSDSDPKAGLDSLTCIEDAGFILARRPQAETLEEYLASIEQRLSLTWNLYKVGVTLRELNQRYCQLGIKFKVPPSHAAQLLARAGRLKTERYRGSLILLPAEFAADLNPETLIEQIRSICKETLGR